MTTALSGATFSPCRLYRYRLWRNRLVGSGIMVAIMLNPSTADETSNDPTVERVWRRAQKLGFARLDVVNIFALRSTDPRALYVAGDPIGPDNDRSIIDACASASIIVCGWGDHGSHLSRGRNVVAMLRGRGLRLHCLAVNKTGHPRHPLYAPYAMFPVPFREDCIA